MLCGPLLWVIGCHEDEYFVRPILIKIDNCAESSSGDDRRQTSIRVSSRRSRQRAFLMIIQWILGVIVSLV